MYINFIIACIVIFILLFIIFLQRNKFKRMRRRWSRNIDWYIPIKRKDKELFLYNFNRYLIRKNINIKDMIMYLNEDLNQNEFKNIIDILLKETSLVKLYLPKDLEPIVIDKKSIYYPYRISTPLNMRQLLSGFKNLSFDYAFTIDEKKVEEYFTNILRIDDRFSDRDFCTHIYFLIMKDKKLYYTNVHQLPIRLIPIHSIDDDGLNHILDKGHVLVLPKKII